MRPVAPRVGLPEVSMAQDQAEYLELTVAPVRFSDGSSGFVTRWRLSEDERRMIGEGHDLYLTMLTGGGPMQPLHLVVGPPEWSTGEEDQP